MVESYELNEIFLEVARKYDYDSFDKTHLIAQFEELDELKIKWERTCSSIRFIVSDYLKDAPKEVLYNIAERLMCMITHNCPPSKSLMVDYITSKEFRILNLDTYLSRHKVKYTGNGKRVPIQDIYDNLLKKLHMENDHETTLAWFKDPSDESLNHCSTAFKTILIATKLDDETIPVEVLEYTLLDGIACNSMGLSADPEEMKKLSLEMRRTYPEREKVIKWTHKHKLWIW